MALDESQEKDLVFTDRDIQFLIDKDLFEEVKPIRVDFVDSFRGSGFKLTSSLQASAGCGGSCDC
jgi:Fe-S cluster assembly iron-binding protein IscA